MNERSKRIMKVFCWHWSQKQPHCAADTTEGNCIMILEQNTCWLIVGAELLILLFMKSMMKVRLLLLID